MAATPPDDDRKTIARSLGEFVGHLWQGVKSEPPKAQRHEVRREVDEEVREGPQGQRVIARRTTIEEIEIQDAGEQG